MYKVIHLGFRGLYVTGMAIWVWAQTSTPTDPVVLWKDVVGIALMCVGALMGLAYRDFSKRVDRNAEGLEDTKDLLTEKLEAIDRRLASIEGSCRLRTCYMDREQGSTDGLS